MMWKIVLTKLTSKKLLTVLLAYSVLILQGSGVINLPAEVTVAASSAMVAHILGQTLIDTKVK